MSSDQPIRMVIVEDNEVFREALEMLLALEPDIDIAGSLPDGETALEQAGELAADVYLVDYRLPDLDGVETIRRLRDVAPASTLLALTAGASPSEVDALLEAGAARCLRKDLDFGEIVGAIRDHRRS